MRVLICGGRDFNDPTLFLEAWRAFEVANGPITTVIEGGALGADRMAKRYGEDFGATVRTFEADWYDLSHPKARIKTDKRGRKYDALAGFRRNQQMIDEGEPDWVIAFPGQNGTADMVKRARKAGIPVFEVGLWT